MWVYSIPKIKNEFCRTVSPTSSSQTNIWYSIIAVQVFFLSFSLSRFLSFLFLYLLKKLSYCHSIEYIYIFIFIFVFILDGVIFYYYLTASLYIYILDGLISYYYLTSSLYIYSRWFNLLLLSNCFSIHIFSMV